MSAVNRASARRRDWQNESAGEASVRLARRHLDAAGEAVERLAEAADPEALHDFRVALRRLRSVMRAYRSCLSKLPKKLRRQLKRVARATSVGRDAEVFLEWLGSHQSFPVSERAAREWMQRWHEQVRDTAYRQLRSEIPADFTALAKRLHQTLTASRNAAPYGEVTAARLHAQLAELAADLAGVHSLADAELIHAARIQAKRLRYLIEPLSRRLPGASTGVKRLRAFQDDTGALCDGFVRRRLFTQAAEAAGAEQARAVLADTVGEQTEITALNDIVPGLRELARRSERQVQHQFRRLQGRYLGPRTQSWLEPFVRLENRLAAPRMK
ncbi:MAG TPA: CHAD domain-containing protein [Candidatus Methylomirabilis sp.]|nr:CHAD domain-containing protein [Candidatus Methylomirabilis sp.]